MAETTAKPKTDWEIAQAAKLRPIIELARDRLGIPPDSVEPYGHDKAKIAMGFVQKALAERKDGKLILVTAINPTPAGEGKTTTTVGLGDALNRIGKKAMICLREPSLGPCFGMKGGAAGGGYSQVVPMDDINLHFTGDFHAIGIANNLLAAVIDNHVYWGNELGIDPRRITWRRCMDMNDRALRQVVNSLGGVANGFPREDGFDITVASEIMAILCLSTSLEDLRRRIGNIVVAQTRDRQPIRASQLKIDGAITAVLKDAIKPNLVQTLENNPAFIHGGIARANLGAEKPGAVTKGLVNLKRHIANLKKFGMPAVVCVNRFPTDTEAELAAVVEGCKEEGVKAFVCTHFADGGKGAEALARAVVDGIAEGKAEYQPLYPDAMPLADKIKTIATEIYRAKDISVPKPVADRLAEFEKQGFGHLPVCMAKTQDSFTASADIFGAPEGFTLPVREVRLSAGAEFVVVICGDIMTMPGLPRVPSAENMYVNDRGQIIGLS